MRKKPRVFFTCYLIILAMFVLLPFNAKGVMAETSNLQNPGFETGSVSPWIHGVVIDTTHQRTGLYCGKVTQSGPSCDQIINGLQPNTSYTFSGYLKVTVAGERVCIGVKNYGGTELYSDVTKTEYTSASVTFTTGPNNTSALVYMYKASGTGDAYGDDFHLVSNGLQVIGQNGQKYSILDTLLISPSYRGLTAENKKGDIQIKTKLINIPGVDLSSIKLVFEVINSDKKVVASTESLDTKNNFNSITGVFNSADLSTGKYTIRVQAIDKSTLEVEDTNDWPLTKINKSDLPTSYVDADGRFIRDGKPFFPIGCFFKTVTKEDVDTFSDSCFNTIIPYNSDDLTPSLMNYIKKKNLKLLYSIKDYFYGSKNCPSSIKGIADEVPQILKTVNKYKNQPSLLGWFAGSEVSAMIDGDRLADHYSAILNADYDHPVYCNDYRLNDIHLYNKLTDAFGVNIYPFSGSNNDNLADSGSASKNAKNDFPDRPLWMCVQIHNPNNYGDDDGVTRYAPGYDEIRCMAWQDICEGATGLIFNSWYDIKKDASGTPFNTLWRYSKKVVKEVESNVSIILSNEAVPPVTIKGGDNWLNWTIRKYNKKVYIYSVNNTRVANRSCSCIIQGAKKCRDLTTGAILPVINGKFTTPAYGALGVKLYEITF